MVSVPDNFAIIVEFEIKDKWVLSYDMKHDDVRCMAYYLLQDLKSWNTLDWNVHV